MQDLLARAELAVERDRRVVAVVGLHENDPRAALRSDLLQVSDQRGRDPAPAMKFCDSEIVDIDLASRLLELRQLVRDEAADNSSFRQRSQRDHMLLRQQVLQIGLARWNGIVTLRIEGLTEQRVQFLKQGDIYRREMLGLVHR